MILISNKQSDALQRASVLRQRAASVCSSSLPHFFHSPSPSHKTPLLPLIVLILHSEM